MLPPAWVSISVRFRLMPGMHETVLAFDFGLRRIGVAVGQQVTGSANPLGAVANRDSGPDWKDIGRYLEEWRPACIVVGMPCHADGSRSKIADAVDAFIDELARFGLPIETIDERHTSIEAEAILKAERATGIRGRISKEMIDSTAAKLIAERWLRNRDRAG